MLARISPEKEILYISRVIDKNIYYYKILNDKGFLSENILSQLRNLVEDVAILINNKINNLNLDSHYKNVSESFDAIKGIKKYKFLDVFHNYLQGTASHYTPSEDGAERLVRYYYRYLCLIKKLLKDEFDIDVINNIDLFPIYDDKSMKENYDIICNSVENANKTNKKAVNGKFYVEKCTTIFSKGDIYYELTLSKATDYNNKFERLTFYSKVYIPDNYSVNIVSLDEKVELNVGVVKIKVITDYKIAIRVCELKNLFNIIGETRKFDDNYKEYRNLMDVLTDDETTIKDILCYDDESFKSTIKQIKNGAENHIISESLEKMRIIIKNNKPGCNILRYLTTKINNLVIRNQLSDIQHPYLSNLFLSKKCGMFDALPYAMSLCNHNPQYRNLIKSIDVAGREDELLYSYIRNQAESNNQLYTPVCDLQQFDNIQDLVKSFNNKVLFRISNSKSILEIKDDFIFIKEYEVNSIQIIKKLEEYSNSINEEISNSVSFYNTFILDDDISDDKKKILNVIFQKSTLALIYGPAGTGKTKMIELLTIALSDYSKYIISNTTTSVSNLKNRLIEDDNLQITTIANFIRNKLCCDILIIDECSMVSNEDMIKILSQNEYKAIILVGDNYQIESIKYGNWFQICSRYFKSGISFELDMTHRTTDEELLKLWNCVRKNDKAAINIMSSKEYSEDISPKIFERTSDEEIILCLNYDGMYGINNINKVMQNSNKNREYTLGVDVFKVDDPVLFNDCPRFNKFTHNNLKGIIKEIEEDSSKEAMWFCIEIDEDSIDIGNKPDDVTLLKSDKKGKIIVKFKVKEFKDKNDDENEYDHIIPFNLAYAISIHKAQGLEYDSVKIVITSNIEDRITKNIFYTAITRTKNKLKVYWNSATQEKIFDSFDKNESKRDLGILNQKIRQL